MIKWLKQLWADWRNLDSVFDADQETALWKLSEGRTLGSCPPKVCPDKPKPYFKTTGNTMNKSSKFDNGDILVDTVTGLEGVVMVVAFYSTGCIHYGIQPRSVKESGEPKDWTWLDESRLCRKQVQAVKFQIVSGRTSGPLPQGPKL